MDEQECGSLVSRNKKKRMQEKEGEIPNLKFKNQVTIQKNEASVSMPQIPEPMRDSRLYSQQPLVICSPLANRSQLRNDREPTRL